MGLGNTYSHVSASHKSSVLHEKPFTYAQTMFDERILTNNNGSEGKNGGQNSVMTRIMASA